MGFERFDSHIVQHFVEGGCCIFVQIACEFGLNYYEILFVCLVYLFLVVLVFTF